MGCLFTDFISYLDPVDLNVNLELTDIKYQTWMEDPTSEKFKDFQKMLTEKVFSISYTFSTRYPIGRVWVLRFMFYVLFPEVCVISGVIICIIYAIPIRKLLWDNSRQKMYLLKGISYHKGINIRVTENGVVWKLWETSKILEGHAHQNIL